jgi:hypothetical protein
MITELTGNILPAQAVPGAVLAGRTVPGNTMRMMLQAVKDVSGVQYERLMVKAGLKHYLYELPADSWRPGGTEEELTRLFATVYEMLGEPLTRLFLLNYGLLLAPRLLQSEVARTLVAGIGPVAGPQRLGWFVQGLALMTGRAWVRQTVSEDAEAYYLTPERCLVCTHVHNAHAPLCADAEALYSSLAKHLVGRVRIVEVECAAMGAAHCKYAFYK